jgi:hypothetical protein
LSRLLPSKPYAHCVTLHAWLSKASIPALLRCSCGPLGMVRTCTPNLHVVVWTRSNAQPCTLAPSQGAHVPHIVDRDTADLAKAAVNPSSSVCLAAACWHTVAAPPSGQPLMPECVPKFVTELVLPQPMPINSAKRKQVTQQQLLQPSFLHLLVAWLRPLCWRSIDSSSAAAGWCTCVGLL